MKKPKKIYYYYVNGQYLGSVDDINEYLKQNNLRVVSGSSNSGTKHTVHHIKAVPA